jgi:hypothetical protein
MDNISILVAAIVSALSVLGLVIKALLDDRKYKGSNGNGKAKQLDDIEDRLEKAITGFKENHLEELLLLRKISQQLDTCSDILKKLES